MEFDYQQFQTDLREIMEKHNIPQEGFEATTAPNDYYQISAKHLYLDLELSDKDE